MPTILLPTKRERAARKPKPKPKPKAKPKPKSFVQTYTPKPKPASTKYIDLNKIFPSHDVLDRPFVTCVRSGPGANDDIMFYCQCELDDPDDAEEMSIDELLRFSRTKGKEEATFLRALAELIDATK